MAKNINTQVWHVDASGYTQDVKTLFTSTPPVYTHAQPIDNSFNFCVNGVAEQKKRAVFHMTDRANNTYTLEDIDCTFIPDAIYDNKGNIGSQSIGVSLGVNGGVSNFTMTPDDLNQPPADFKILVNFTYLTSVWAPRINIRTYDREAHHIGRDHYMTLNQLDAESTAADAEEGETWWEYYKRNETDYILTMDRYNSSQYHSTGAFQNMPVFEGQTRAGLPTCRVSWLMTPNSYGNTYGTSGCYIYHGNGRDLYDDMTFDVLFSMSTSMIVKKDEWDDTQYSKPRHNIIYGVKIDRDAILHIICSYGLPFSFSDRTNISIGNNDYALPEIKNNTTTGNYFRGQDAITADTDNNRWANTKDIDNKPAGGGGGDSGDDIDKQHFGGGTSLGGAENLWLLTTEQMHDLHGALSSCSEANFDPMQSIISVMGLAIPPKYPLGTDISTLITITFKKADGTRWSSHVEGHICDKQTASFGFTNNIKIKRRYNNFLDFPPYASHEIFLPLCGWLPLPAYAVGRNLNVYYVHDINTCSVRALVLCEGSLIGEKYGSMGANIAFSSNGHSLYLGGLITGGVQTLADFTMAITGEGPMALMSAMKGIADGANTLVSANQNRTSVIGQNQDRTSFADGQFIRIKSTYPDVKIEENFGHTYGFVCNKKGKLKDFRGFTTCENPHVTGFSCTSTEKDEIEQLLKSGIIINISE